MILVLDQVLVGLEYSTILLSPLLSVFSVLLLQVQQVSRRSSLVHKLLNVVDHVLGHGTFDTLIDPLDRINFVLVSLILLLKDGGHAAIENVRLIVIKGTSFV